MTGALSPVHWLIIIGVVVLLFGAKKLPDAARGLGQSMRILKSEVTAAGHDDPPPPTSPPAAATSQAPAAQSAPGGDVSVGDDTVGDRQPAPGSAPAVPTPTPTPTPTTGNGASAGHRR